MTAQWWWDKTPEQIKAITRNGMEWEMRPENWEHRRTWINQSSAGTFPVGDAHIDLINAGLAIERDHGGRMPAWHREFTTFDINACMDASNETRPSIYPHTANIDLPSADEQSEVAKRKAARMYMRTIKMDDMTDDDIAASAETAAKGITPSQLLQQPDAVSLVGEAAAAHLALQEAAREAHAAQAAAQAALTAAQTKLRACMERWLRANGPSDPG